MNYKSNQYTHYAMLKITFLTALIASLMSRVLDHYVQDVLSVVTVFLEIVDLALRGMGGGGLNFQLYRGL
jgi:hypothetical protein